MSAFFNELEKVAAFKAPGSPWAPKTVGAARSKMPPTQFPKAPTAPGPMSPKLVKPAGKFGPRQDYSQPVGGAPVGPASDQGVVARDVPPPNV